MGRWTGVWKGISGLGSVGLLLLVSSPAPGQGVGAEPRLPGAVTSAPAWLREAPFDVSGFFAMPPPAENAAPLYLEALLDFGGDMAVCLPADRRGRAATAEATGQRIRRAYDAWDKAKDSDRPDWAEVDALAVALREPLPKLDAAQRRPRCLFATGITYDAPVPHLQVAREPVRLWILLAIRALDRGEVDAAIGHLRRILRLSQDVRPAGHAIAQLVGTAMDGLACNILVPRILAHRKLRANHCDQILRLLEEHKARTAHGFATGVKREYVTLRGILRAFGERVALGIDANGRTVETTLDDDGVARYFLRLASDILSNVDPSKRLAPSQLDDPASLARARAQLAAVNSDPARERRALDDYTKAMLSLPDVPYAQRVAEVEGVLRRYDPRAVPAGQGAFLLTMILPNFRNIVVADVHDRLYVGAAQCLCAARRWQLLHQGQLAGLGVMCRAAGVARVPIDGYGDAPLRMVVIAKQPVIYSVGPDGDDDGGLKDGDLGRVADGDWLFRIARTSSPPER